MLKQKRKRTQSQESGGKRKTRRKGDTASNPAESVDWDGFSIPVVATEEKGATTIETTTLESKQLAADPASSEKAKLYRPPTHDELSALKETQDLFKSNLMKLQITELLDEVRGKKRKKRQSTLEEFLHSLKTFLTTLPSSKTVQLTEFESLLPKAVRYPLGLRPTCTGKSSFQFHPPSLVKVVGGYLLGTTIATNTSIDLSLLIPESCLEARDFLNFRYFHKRALYIALVAGHLRKKKLLFSHVKFTYDHGNPLLPIIVLHPKDPLLAKYTIAIHTSVPATFFNSDKLYPNKNNVRRKLMFDVTSDDQELEGSLSPTPCYNTAVLLEMGARERHLHELYAAGVECPAITDATLLFKVWVKQRDLHQGYGGFTGFHFAMLMTHLLWKKKLNHLMSCYQVFRVTLQYLATCDWSTSGLCMADRDQYPSLPPVSLFHECFPVVFLDSSGLLNLCAGMSSLQFQQLRHQAALSHTHLDDHAQSGSGFEATFIRRVPSVLQYDTLCSIQLSSAVVKGSAVMDTPTWEGTLLDSAGWAEPHVLNKLVPVLVKGLGTRVKLIGQQPWADCNWSVSEAPPTLSDHITLGLLYDTDHAHNAVEMGPPANSSEAREFRTFWGEISELHRFADGSINEAVMWRGESASERRTVCGQIIKHVLNRHANIPSSSIDMMVSVTDPLLYHHSYHTSEASSDGSHPTGEEQTLQVIRVFVELSRQLRVLRDLPLEVSTVQGAAAVFTHTEVFPPVPWNGKMAVELRATTDKTVQSHCFYPSCNPSTPQYVPCFQVVCQLEASGKWPDKLDAIDKIKTAFLIHIGRLLRDQCHLVTAPSRQYLDVLKDGFVFRLHIFHPKETHLLKNELSTVKGPAAADMEKRLVAMERDMVAKPLLTGTLSGIQQQYPSYGPAARLCKRWIAAHLLTNHITDEAVDLLVAHLYLHPAPYTPPCTPVCSLLRFLSLLSTFDWSNDPLIVNLNTDLSDGDIAEIRSTFTSQRSRLPLIFIATPLDKTSSQWTQSGPSLPVMSRLLLLARESLSTITSQLESTAQRDQDYKQIFRSPLSDYNVLIHLHKRHLPCYSQNIEYSGPTPRTNPGHTFRHLPVVDFDPVLRYLNDLEEAFSEFALFFHDKYGGSVIGVVWKPHSFAPQPFKLMNSHPRIKDRSESNKVVPDVSAIIDDFKLVGTGLVKSVEVLSSLIPRQ